MMASNLTIRKSFIRSSFSSKYELSAPLMPGALSILTDRCLKELVPPEAYKGEPLIDLKGRDRQNLINQELSSGLWPQGDELIFVAGKVFLDNISEHLEARESTASEFTASLLTNFDSFKGTHHISHNVEIKKHGQLPDFVPISHLGRAFPMVLENFRLGLDLFTSALTLSSLGFVPTVTQTLLIEATPQKMLLSIEAERLKAKEQFPLQQNDLWSRLSKIIEATCKVNLEEDYLSRLKDS